MLAWALQAELLWKPLPSPVHSQEDPLSLHAVQALKQPVWVIPKHHSLYISALKRVTSVKGIQGREPGGTTRHHSTAGVRALLLGVDTPGMPRAALLSTVLQLAAR